MYSIYANIYVYVFYNSAGLPLVDLQLDAAGLVPSLVHDLLRSEIKKNKHVEFYPAGGVQRRMGGGAGAAARPYVHPQHRLLDGCGRSDHLFVHHVPQLLLPHVLPLGPQILDANRTVRNGIQQGGATFTVLCLINQLKLFFFCLKKVENNKNARKVSLDIARYLLF